MIWEIRIPRQTPSQNVLARRFKNVYAYKKLRDELQSWIMVGMANGGIPKATGKRKLTITRYTNNKRLLLDRGNFVGGCKPLLDAATRQGLILDDKEQLLDEQYVQLIGPPEVRIRIEDV